MKALRDSETKYIAVLIHVIYPYSRKKNTKNSGTLFKIQSLPC